MKKNNKGAVYWLLPGKKKPIAYSTVAVSEFIVMMAAQYLTIKDIYYAINYDEDAKDILKKYIDYGYGETVAKELFT